MGNESSVSAQAVNDIVYAATEDCGSVSAHNVEIFNDSTYDPPDSCPPDQQAYTVDQNVSVQADCYLASLQKYTAEAAFELTDEQKAALGINISSTQVDIENQLQVTVDQACADVDAGNTHIVNGARINACGYIITQNATAQQNCQINATIDVLNDAAVTIDKSQEGWDPIGAITGFFESIGVGTSVVSAISSCACAMLIISIFAFLLYRKSTKPDYDLAPSDVDPDSDLMAAATEFDMAGGGRKSRVILWVVAILGIILLALLLFSKPHIFKRKEEKPYTSFGVPMIRV